MGQGELVSYQRELGGALCSVELVLAQVAAHLLAHVGELELQLPGIRIVDRLGGHARLRRANLVHLGEANPGYLASPLILKHGRISLDLPLLGLQAPLEALNLRLEIVDIFLDGLIVGDQARLNRLNGRRILPVLMLFLGIQRYLSRYLLSEQIEPLR